MTGAGVQIMEVDHDGCILLPPDVLERWSLQDGGPVEAIDLGWGMFIGPEGLAADLRRELLPSQEEHAELGRGLDDPGLRTT
jgi:hypothetical protein